MFNIISLFISLSSPAAIFIAMLFIDLVFKTWLSSAVIILLYAQHVYLGELFGVNLHSGTGWIPLRYNGNFLLFNLLLDYLLVATLIYVLLTALTKCFFRSKFALPA